MHSKTLQALRIAKRDNTRLANINSQAEQRSHIQSVYTAQLMTKTSLEQLEETIKAVRTFFIMPSKDLK